MTYWYASVKPELALDLGVNEKCKFSVDTWGRFRKHCHSVLKVDAAAVAVVIVEFNILIWEYFLGRFQVFSHLFAS